jgi:hypothetical protein
MKGKIDGEKTNLMKFQRKYERKEKERETMTTKRKKKRERRGNGQLYRNIILIHECSAR